MQNEENTEEIVLETENNQEETVEQTESEQTSEETQEDSVEAKLAKAEAEANKYRRLFEKSQKPKVVTPQATQPASPVAMQVLILQDKGMPDELMEELKLRAPKYEGNLLKAQSDLNFIAVKERFEKEQKSENASLPASRGSGNIKPKKTLTSPNLSREEHMALTKNLS